MNDQQRQTEAACGGSTLTAELGLKPCPFCGKTETLEVITGQELMDEEQEFWRHADSFAVVCDASTPDGKGGCGGGGGFMPTEAEAVARWNTRPND